MDDMTPLITRVAGQVMSVNSYLVDTGAGVVVVDAQLCVSDARTVRVAVDATGKPLLAVLVTHPHPDHYAGAATLTAALDVPLVSTAAVAAVIARDDAEKDRIVGPMMGEEWPTKRSFPDTLVEDGQTLRYGDIDVTVSSWGPGESHADTVWAVGDALFVGDLVYHDEHAYLADGHGSEWLESLTRLEARLTEATTLYVGHGAPGGVGLVAAQRTYVETFLRAVEDALDLDPAEGERLVLEAIRPLAGNDGLLFLAQLSIEPTIAMLRHAEDRSSAS